MKIQQIIDVIEQYAPSSLALDFDNVGLLLGDAEWECSGVFISLDATLASINRAIELGANLIICHHPVMFNPIKRITPDQPEGKRLLLALTNKIAIFAAHTNMDRVAINHALAEAVGGKNAQPFTEDCVGVVCEIEQRTVLELSRLFATILQDTNISVIGDQTKQVRKVAIISGGGGSSQSIKEAKQAADVFVTADMKYHLALEAVEIGLPMIIVGHYTSEIIFKKIVYSVLSTELSNNAPTLFVNDLNENPYNDKK